MVVVEQIKLNLNVTVLDSDKNEDLKPWDVFQKALEMSGVKDLKHFCSHR